MTIRQPPNSRKPAKSQRLPWLWLVSDARNDAALERVLRRLPRGSGLVFRHYQLRPENRRQRFDRLARIARGRGHVVALSGTARQAREWGAQAVYGPPQRLRGAAGLLRLATVHSMRELGAARRAGADLVFVSPVFPTRSHRGGAVLGPLRALMLARQAGGGAIMLGGMNRARFRAFAAIHHVRGWAAIDGLSTRFSP
ncbi:thiamine phosphate synthase [Croceicoccus sp. Ery5]|uniref:thiamine phosphate synthase n=1 Tax=Croceicoccus sp. Ery5 TaxID=1703340 RepID=UPI001E50C794|nr:thiamine phosphate synthase [Croceicoccus sp. Ery5]